MFTRVATTSLIFVLLAAAPAAATAGSTGSSSPSLAQMRAAAARAKRSPKLWATINICNTRRHRNAVGIRGQMPALGFQANMSMQFQVDYWNPEQGRFLPDRGVLRRVNLGPVSYGVEQGGAIFHFPAHAGRLRGMVTFEWRKGGRLLGKAMRVTTWGHQDADHGDPPRHSAASCMIA